MAKRAGFFDKYGKAVMLGAAAALILGLIFTGRPIQRYWTAASSLIRAGALSIQQGPDGQFVRSAENEIMFKELCRLSMDAYKNNPGVFKLSGIKRAQTGCRLSGHKTAEQTFIQFERTYRKEHPDEH